MSGKNGMRTRYIDISAYNSIGLGLRCTDVLRYTLPFKRFDDIDYNFWSFVPEDISEYLKCLREADVRTSDVFVCTYPRSGTNWTYEIVNMLVSGNTNYIKTEPKWIDFEPYENFHQNQESRRVVCSHLPLRYLPKELANKGKIIRVVRNPKDVAVSLHNYLQSVTYAIYDAPWEEFLALFYEGNLPGGSWFDYQLEWEKDLEQMKESSILTLTYENMKNDLIGNINVIAKFLDIPQNETLFLDIAEKCEFTKMNIEKNTNIPPDIANTSVTNSNYIYRQGKVGGWKDWFTVAQNEEFNRIFNSRMKHSKIFLEYN